MKDDFYSKSNEIDLKLEQYSADNQLIKRDLNEIDQKIDNKINQKLIDYKFIQPRE